MSKYSKIEIDTARNLVRDGYHWIARTPSGKLVVDKTEMLKDVDGWLGSGFSFVVACKWVPIFPDVTWHDDHPTCLDDIAYPSILDDTERRYLERVLRPLPKIKCITKIPTVTCLGMMEYLFVKIVRIGDDKAKINDSLRFPYFQAGTMYKGMISGRDYTPDELKLNLGEKA